MPNGDMFKRMQKSTCSVGPSLKKEILLLDPEETLLEILIGKILSKRFGSDW